MKQVLIVDDDSLVREYLAKEAYNLFGDSEIFTTSTLVDALTICKQKIPSTILLDLVLPDTTGLKGLYAVRELCPDSCIIMISGTVPSKNVLLELKNLANGFLTKSSHHLTQLADAIHAIESGTEIFENPHPPHASITHTYSGLSPVENQLLQMFRNGLRVKDVIEQTRLSESYVKSVRRNIKEKLGPDIFAP